MELNRWTRRSARNQCACLGLLFVSALLVQCGELKPNRRTPFLHDPTDAGHGGGLGEGGRAGPSASGDGGGSGSPPSGNAEGSSASRGAGEAGRAAGAGAAGGEGVAGANGGEGPAAGSAGSAGGPANSCGDGHLDLGEECDDANAGAGCDGNCAIEEGWECAGEPSHCEDIDECKADPNVCGEGVECQNLTGSYHCSDCGEGSLGDRLHGCAPTVTLAALTEFNCALPREGGVFCWGDDESLQITNAPKVGTFRSLGVGVAHACAIRSDASLACWGDNRAGQISDAPDGRYKSIAGGDWFSCSVDLEGHAQCWGDWNHAPTPPAGEYRSITAGMSFACAIRTDDKVVCFGDPELQVVQQVPEGRFTSVRAGHHQACAIRENGEAECWGETSDGKPQVPPGQYLAIAPGDRHTCAIQASAPGYVDCWGASEVGQGNTQLADNGSWRQIVAGITHACALGKPALDDSVDGTIVCWGFGWADEDKSPVGVFKLR